MGVRIRANNKTIVCAARSKKRKGDCLLDDGVHYCLAAELKVMSVFSHDKNGADLWRFHSPRKTFRRKLSTETMKDK